MATIGQILIDENYQGRSQLLHMLVFTLERLAWLQECDVVFLVADQIDFEIAIDLDYDLG